MEAGQLDVNDPVILGDKIWRTAERGHSGDVSLTHDDGGGCITVVLLGETEEVEHAGVRLANARGERDHLRARRERMSLTDGARRLRIAALCSEIDWLEAQGVKGAIR